MDGVSHLDRVSRIGIGYFNELQPLGKLPCLATRPPTDKAYQDKRRSDSPSRVPSSSSTIFTPTSTAPKPFSVTISALASLFISSAHPPPASVQSSRNNDQAHAWNAQRPRIDPLAPPTSAIVIPPSPQSSRDHTQPSVRQPVAQLCARRYGWSRYERQPRLRILHC